MMSVNGARMMAYSINTLTPFLYQTNTLHSIKQLSITCFRPSNICKCRRFTSKPSHRSTDGSNKSPATSKPLPPTTRWNPLLPSSSSQSTVSSAEDSRGVVETTQDTVSGKTKLNSLESASSFYETRTRGNDAPETNEKPDVSKDISSSSTTASNSVFDRRSKLSEVMGMRDHIRAIETDGEFEQEYDSIDFDEDLDGTALTSTDEIAELTRHRPLGESTITDSERYAFQKVFRDMFGKQQGTTIGLNDPIDSSLPGADMNLGRSSTAGARKMSRFEMEEMVGRYPAPLRSAAARAIGLMEVEAEGNEESTEFEPELDMEKLESLREPERRRVETLMKDAKTDVDLWNIMEQEVFSLISRLGLEEAPQPQGKRKVKSRSKKLDVTENKDQFTTGESALLEKFTVNEDGISPLALYGPLYPSYLLLGLRLLDRSFAKSSSLTLALLPKIKSLGLISHVLGASSQLYNELLQIHRYRHDDYRGILSLLGEMENSGIEFDKTTLEIVKDIQRTQLSVSRGEKGPVIQALWNLPEFAPNKFKVWYDKIGGDINYREMTRRTPIGY